MPTKTATKKPNSHHPNALCANRRGELPLQAYADDMAKFIAFLQQRYGKGILPGDVTEGMIREFLTFLGEKGFKKKNSPGSRERRLPAIKSFFKFAYRQGLVRENPAAWVSMARVRKGEPSFLTVEEYKRLMQVAERRRSDFFRTRDYCIILMILATGARVGELTKVSVGDVSLRGKTVKLHRKGGEEQMLPLSEKLIAALKKYLRIRRKRTRSRALFISTRNTRISKSAVWRLIKGYCRKARIKKDRLGPHMLRHTFATTMLANGENLRTIQILMNHKNLSTTSRYLHSHDTELAKAVNRISL